MYGCNNEYDKILGDNHTGKLFIGNNKAAIDEKFINREKIKTVINVTNDIPMPFTDIVKYYQIPINDKGDELNNKIMSSYLPKILKIINDELKNGNNVLIHCYAGISRSATVVVAYLMKYKKMKMDEAVKYVLSIRPCVFFFGMKINFKKSLDTII